MYELNFRRQPFARETVVSRERSSIELQCSVHLGLHLLLLVLAGGTGLLALKESLAVFVKLESGDDTVGRVNGELRLLSIDLLSGHLVNIDAPSSAVNAHDFALTIGVSSTNNFNAITLADGDGLASVLSAEVLGEVSGKQFSTLG